MLCSATCERSIVVTKAEACGNVTAVLHRRTQPKHAIVNSYQHRPTIWRLLRRAVLAGDDDDGSTDPQALLLMGLVDEAWWLVLGDAQVHDVRTTPAGDQNAVATATVAATERVRRPIDVLLIPRGVDAS